MLRALTKNLDLKGILDRLTNNHKNTAHEYLEPYENSDCSEGYDDTEDKGHSTQIPRPILQVEKEF